MIENLEKYWYKWLVVPFTKVWSKISNIYTVMLMWVVVGIVISIIVYKRIPEDSKWLFWLWLMK